MSTLHLHTRRAAGADVLTVQGPMVAVTAMTLHAALERLQADPAAVIVVDLAAAAPCDLTAVTVLRAAAAVARSNGGAVRLAAVSPEALTVLESAKALRYLPTYLTVEDALEG
ncbi:STAS domain-containing protein [Dactylosporangium sp. McL0621]|uniref:STAS domain-containing protein n=1 Tax=Dactylosporangium sp. McL0621 TaxID=3415678 RepID=UPI003CEE979D